MGVLLCRGRKYFLCGARLNNVSMLHDDNVVSETLDDTKIMRNKEVSHVVFILQGMQEFYNLSLDGYIQCRCWLIEY